MNLSVAPSISTRLLAVCLALGLAACSSDGDDTDTVDITPIDDSPSVTTPAVGILDALRDSEPALTSLIGAIDASPELTRLLDDRSRSLTLFAPNDAAFGVASLELSTLDGAQMNQILRDHVLPLNLDATEALARIEQPVAAVGGTLLTVSQAVDGALQVTAREGDPVSMNAGSSIVADNVRIYFIDRLIPGTVPEAISDDPAVAAASATGIIRATPNLSDFSSLLSEGFFDLTLADPMNASFIIIAPTNGNLSVDRSAVTRYLQEHIINDPSLGSVLVPGVHSTTANTLITVDGTADALLIDGAPLSLLAGPGTPGGAVYALEGELPDG